MQQALQRNALPLCLFAKCIAWQKQHQQLQRAASSRQVESLRSDCVATTQADIRIIHNCSKSSHL